MDHLLTRRYWSYGLDGTQHAVLDLAGNAATYCGAEILNGEEPGVAEINLCAACLTPWLLANKHQQTT